MMTLRLFRNITRNLGSDIVEGMVGTIIFVMAIVMVGYLVRIFAMTCRELLWRSCIPLTIILPSV